MSNTTEPTYRQIEFEIRLDGEIFIQNMTFHQPQTLAQAAEQIREEIERQIEERPYE